MRNLITMMLLLFTLSGSAQTTSEMRFKHVEKHLNMPKPAFDKVAPVLKAYIKAMKEAGDIYDDIKDEYKSEIKSGKLTDGQAAKLIKAKMASEAKEVEVKKQYYTKFKEVTTDKYIYKIFKYAADKKSKFMPTKSKNEDDED